MPIKMFQYEICPFCNKIKAVLDYCKVPYDTVEVKRKREGEREREMRRGTERRSARASEEREREFNF